MMESKPSRIAVVLHMIDAMYGDKGGRIKIVKILTNAIIAGDKELVRAFLTWNQR
jgi:hypothetical protein